MLNIGYSELIVLDRDVEQNVDQLIAHGAEHVELFMDASGWEAHQDKLPALAKRLKDKGVPILVHPAAWDCNMTAEIRGLREAAFEQHRIALDFAAELGSPSMVVHPGTSFFQKETARKRAHEYTCRLAELAKPYQIRLAFENIGGPSTSLYTEENFFHALDDVDPIAGYLIDVGHAHINGWNIPKMLRENPHRLLGLHLHDNHGASDEHLPLGQGTIPFPEMVEALRACGERIDWTLEYNPGTPLETLQDGRDMLLKLWKERCC